MHYIDVYFKNQYILTKKYGKSMNKSGIFCQTKIDDLRKGIAMYYEVKKDHSIWMALILILLLIIIVILIGVGRKVEHYNMVQSEEIELTATLPAEPEFNLQDLVKNASYSVVGVSKWNEKNTSVFVENSEEKLGIGSGIILASNGFILSNFETTGGKGESCYITLKNGTIYPAAVLWADSDRDISIVKIAAENLLYLTMGDSNQIQIGDKLYVLSNATGYDFNTNLEEVFISKESTTLKFFEEGITFYAENVMKSSLKIQSQSNGGAVLNKDGEVVGIASSKINAIIPIQNIKTILEKLKEDEDYQMLDLRVYGFDYEVIKYLLPDYPLTMGIYVDNVKENSRVSGKVFQGDIITKIDEEERYSFQELNEYLLQKNEKEKITLTVIRGTKEVVLVVEL